MKDKNIHLNEDQILLSLVEEHDLSEETRSHLLACLLCQEERTALMSELEHLGEMAKDFSPMPQNKPVLPFRESGHFIFNRPVLSAGFAVVLIIACLWSLTLFIDSSKQMTPGLSTDMKVDLYLMDDILEESALPEYYLDIGVASYTYFDEEFMDFVVPQGEGFNSV